MQNTKTIVISCAGMGNRLGLNTTKAIIDIAGKPLLLRQLELLQDWQDIRIVVGYQAQAVIDMVLPFRKDVQFVYNHEYLSTGTGGSLQRAVKGLPGDRLVVSLDGDLLVHPQDLAAFLSEDTEQVGACTPTSDEAVYLHTDKHAKHPVVTGFTRQRTDLEWTGLAQIRRGHMGSSEGHVFQVLEPALPLNVKLIRTREIDTPADYKRAVQWVTSGYPD